MSSPSRISGPTSVSCLLAAAARQVVIAGLAAAGVVAVGGCAKQPAAGTGVQAPAPAMRSVANVPPEATLLEDTDVLAARRPPRSTKPPAVKPRAVPERAADPVASQAERKRSQRAEVDALMEEAMTPPAAPPARAADALGVSARAVAPLADTVAAIDAAQQVVFDNLRNLETAGYKASRTAVGDGRDAARQLDATQGELQASQRALDVAVQGEGFFQVQVYTPEHPEGVVGFTRNGQLFVNGKGEVVLAGGDGYKLIPPMTLPTGTTELTIDRSGNVAVVRAGSDVASPTTVGRFHLARFTDPTALQPLGGGIYAETDASGPAVESPAGDRGAGVVLQGYLEASNVDLIRERMRLRFLQTWRASLVGAIDAAPPGPTPAATPARRTGRGTETTGE